MKTYNQLEENKRVWNEYFNHVNETQGLFKVISNHKGETTNRRHFSEQAAREDFNNLKGSKIMVDYSSCSRGKIIGYKY
jgi:hypothetical protein